MNNTNTRAGVYSLTVTGTNSCTASATVNVVVNGFDPFQLPIALVNNGTVCVGSPIRITATGGATTTNNPGTMHYYGPDGFYSSILGNQSTLVRNNAQIANAGTYTVVFVPNNGRCPVSSTTDVSVQSCARIASAEESSEEPIQLEASPNPTDGRVVVKIRLTEASPVVLKLADASGRQAGEWNLSRTDTYHETEISLERNPAGVYILSAESNHHATAKKIIRVDK